MNNLCLSCAELLTGRVYVSIKNVLTVVKSASFFSLVCVRDQHFGIFSFKLKKKLTQLKGFFALSVYVRIQYLQVYRQIYLLCGHYPQTDIQNVNDDFKHDSTFNCILSVSLARVYTHRILSLG